MIKKVNSNICLLVFFCTLVCWAKPLLAEDLLAKAVAEKTEVYVGESFLLQIQIEGDESPKEPTLPPLPDFQVQFLGGQQNSSSSVTIINGRVSQQVQRGYVFSYRLSAKRPGALDIPPVTILAAGRQISTQAIRILAEKPRPSKDFHLKLELSPPRAYVGQPVTLSVRWFIGKDVQDFRFSIPLLEDPRFEIADLETEIDQNRKDRYLRISLPSGEVIASKGRHSLKGKDFMTISFKKVLIPNTAGLLRLGQATVSGSALAGYRRTRRSADPLFDRFFNDDLFFGQSRRAVRKNFVVPSNEAELEVLELPSSKQPKNFDGLVGNYSITASASPTEVRVGDPITLTIQVTGPQYLENVELAPLASFEEISKNFKVPQGRADGKIRGRVKTFTQTIRANSPNIRSIPSIELPYFDVEEDAYRTAKTQPIPIQVEGTKVVTATDAEGNALAKQVKTELERLAEGIMHNYEDPSALQNEALSRSGFLSNRTATFVLLFPPLLYFSLFGLLITIRKRNADPQAVEARQAFGKLEKSVKKIASTVETNPELLYPESLEALKRYLGERLRLPAGALTFKDAKKHLVDKKIEEDVLFSVKEIFDTCEAYRFSQSSEETNPQEFLQQLLSSCKAVEGKLR